MCSILCSGCDFGAFACAAFPAVAVIIPTIQHDYNTRLQYKRLVYNAPSNSEEQVWCHYQAKHGQRL